LTEAIIMFLALEDRARGEEIAAALALEESIAVHSGDEFDALAEVDVVVTDGAPLDAVTPHVTLVPHGGMPADDPNVRAVLAEDASAELIAAAAKLVAAGYRVIPGPALAQQRDDLVHAERHFSARESEVLALLAEGAPNKVIARRLNISVHTAKFHVAAIMQKLGAANRTDAIAIAMREGLILI
jgi:DNA-binding CsgD family transcriptional regulator